MANNQIQISSVTTTNNDLNQVQQNVNKVFRNLSIQIESSSEAISEMTIVGEIKLADLTISQFQGVAGKDWILANGQSSVGTAYQQLTGNTTVPTISVAGTNAFIRVN